MRPKEREFLSIWALLLVLGLFGVLALAVRRMDVQALPENVGRELTAQEQAEIIARNSPLTEYVRLSPNVTFPREDAVKKITVHHMADAISLERLGEVFAEEDRRASANYAIDIEGRVALYAEECNRAWTSSSPANDHQAVTIEVANDEIGGDWHVGDASYATLVELCTDICRRNGIERLAYTGDEQGNLTIHKMFNEETECPGPYLERKMPELAFEVNQRLAEMAEHKGGDAGG